jgi:hypothetical protein
VELSVWERFRLLNILPEKGSFVTLKLVRKLRESLSFTEEEMGLYDFKQDGERVMWNPDAPQVKEFQFGPKTMNIISDALRAVDKRQMLDQTELVLFEKFVDTTQYDLGGEAG